MNFKSLYLTGMAVLGLFPGSFTSQAQPEQNASISTSLNVDLVSRYIWRGLDLGKGPSVQPGLSASWKGFTLGAWGAYNLTGSGGQETDFYLSKTVGFVTLSLWDYWSFDENENFDFFNYRQPGTAHLLETQLLLTGGESFPFNLMMSYFFYGADLSNSVYLELQYQYSSSFADLLIFSGYQAKGTFYSPGKGFVNLGCTVKKSIEITERFSLPVSLSVIVNPAGKSAWLVAGISL